MTPARKDCERGQNSIIEGYRLSTGRVRDRKSSKISGRIIYSPWNEIKRHRPR